MTEYHPKHGYLPWAAERAQSIGLFHVAALIRSAMARIEALEWERDNLRIDIGLQQRDRLRLDEENARLREALQAIVDQQRVGVVDEIARAALEETE